MSTREQTIRELGAHLATVAALLRALDAAGGIPADLAVRARDVNAAASHLTRAGLHPPDEEWLLPLPLSKIALRLGMSEDKARAMLGRTGLDKLTRQSYRVRLDTLDNRTRKLIESGAKSGEVGESPAKSGSRGHTPPPAPPKMRL